MKMRNGIYQADFVRSDGLRVRKSLGTAHKAEATILQREMMAKEEAELKAKPQEKGPSPLLRVTFEQAYRKALRTRKQWRESTSPATLEGNYERLCTDLKDIGGSKATLAALMDHDWLTQSETWRDTDKLSASTINQRLSLISTVLKEAEVWPELRGLVRVPKMPRQKPAEGRMATYDHALEDRIIKHWQASQQPKAPQMLLLARVLFATGFRLSEALRLYYPGPSGHLPEDSEGRIATEIDLARGLFLVWDQKGKTQNGVPMAPSIKEELSAHAKPSTWLFQGLTKDRADKLWAKARKELGVSKDLKLHSTRHTAATRLAAGGFDTARIKTFMRHKNVSTTLKYIHLAGADVRDLADALDRKA